MKILIVSGFLGAGKTTFIREMIRRCGIKPVVLENEYGQTDLDAQMLAPDSADVWGLQEGCICCTKSADMANSVIAIENVLEPDFLVIEPSGVAKLGSVIARLKQLEYGRIILLKPVAVVDALAFQRDRKAFADIYENQVRAADTIVFSKLATVSPEETAAMEAVLREMNPEAEIVSSRYEDQPEAWWKSLLTNAFSGRLTEADDALPPDLETVTLTDCRVDSPVGLLSVLNNALWGKYGTVIRAKGILPCTGCGRLQFDLAGGLVKISGYDEPASAECVWIGYGLAQEALEERLCARLKGPHHHHGGHCDHDSGHCGHDGQEHGHADDGHRSCDPGHHGH